jgi:DNA-directed RNA polymerase subunit RPC12/RpoP
VTEVEMTPNATAAQARCAGCGGVLLYDPAVRCLRCRHCSAQAPVPASGAPGPRELSLRDGLARAPRGYGTETLRVECGSCGAIVHLAPEERATRCTYCASPTVVTRPPDPSLLQPESMIPFLVPQPQATQGFERWLSGLWFRPGDLSRMARVEGVHGVYLPYWTFDADVESQWQAERGEYYYTTEHYTDQDEHGNTVRKTRQVQHTRWKPARGRRKDHFDDVLVCASRGVKEDLAAKLCTFDTKQLVPYSPGYLYGWRAEAYAVDLPGAWAKGQEAIRAQQEQKCAGDIGGDTHRNLEVQNTFRKETFKHVLLPLFVLAYRYNGRPYQVLVNGQTGEVVGKAPLSVWKVMALVIPANLLVLLISIVALPLLLITIPLMIYEVYLFHKHWDDWFG